MLRPCLIPTVCFLLGAQSVPFESRAALEEGRFLKVLAEAEARLRTDDSNAIAWAAKAQALCSFMRLEEAEAAAGNALKLQPDLSDALVARAMVMAGKAVRQKNLGSLGMLSKAMSDLKEAVKIDADYPLAWQTLALGYQFLPGILGGSTKKALECAEQLKRIAPARGNALHGRILSMDGKWDIAEPIFKRALAMASNDPEIVSAYLEGLGEKTSGKILGEELQKQRLAAEARRLLPLVRDRARGVEAVSQALLEAGQYEDSWSIALDALSGVDAPSIIRLQLGKVAARTGLHSEEGLAFLDRAAKEPLEGGTGGYVAVHWRRGQILKTLGRIGEAREAAKKALTYDSTHQGAKKLLSELG